MRLRPAAEPRRRRHRRRAVVPLTRDLVTTVTTKVLEEQQRPEERVRPTKSRQSRAVDQLSRDPTAVLQASRLSSMILPLAERSHTSTPNAMRHGQLALTMVVFQDALGANRRVPVGSAGGTQGQEQQPPPAGMSQPVPLPQRQQETAPQSHVHEPLAEAQSQVDSIDPTPITFRCRKVQSTQL